VYSCESLIGDVGGDCTSNAGQKHDCGEVDNTEHSIAKGKDYGAAHFESAYSIIPMPTNGNCGLSA
jgi:hypothetical protein